MENFKKIFNDLSSSHREIFELGVDIDGDYPRLSELTEVVCELFTSITNQDILEETLEKLTKEYQGFLEEYKLFQNKKQISNFNYLFYNVVYRFLDDLKQEEASEALLTTDQYKSKFFEINYNLTNHKATLSDGSTFFVFQKYDFNNIDNERELIERISDMGTVEKVKTIQSFFNNHSKAQSINNNCVILYELRDENPDFINEFTLKLLQVSKNETTHIAVEHQSTLPQIKISASENYEQFNDILYILSEYNQEKKVIYKFLKLYQILENFQIKSEIVKMINEQPDKFLSVRNIQALTDNLEKNESVFFKKTLLSIGALQYNQNKTIEDIIKEDFNDFKDNYLANEENKSTLLRDLKELKVKKLPDDISNLGIAKLSDIIYQLRCSVVHNKLYEVHLTDDLLREKKILVDFLKIYLVPILEKIIYKVISEKNTLLWYESKEIKLY